MFSIAAGIGQDSYDQSATLTGTVNQFGASASQSLGGDTNRWRRTNFFGDFSINLPVLKIVVEAGEALGGIGRDVQLVRRRTRRPLAGLRIVRPSPEPVRSPARHDRRRAARGRRPFMRRALALAERGWGQTAPNPMVGAVVVRDGLVVGEGWHARFGDAHAEVDALRAAGERARGRDALRDPRAVQSPRQDAAVRGRDHSRGSVARRRRRARSEPRSPAAAPSELRAAGVVVDVGVEERRRARAQRAFFHAQTSERPWVTLKLALSPTARSPIPSPDNRLAHRRGGARARCTGCARTATRSPSASAPCSPTIPRSPCATLRRRASHPRASCSTRRRDCRWTARSSVRRARHRPS